MCRRAAHCGGFSGLIVEDMVDEMMGEVVDRIPRIVEVWDPTLGVPLRPYVIGQLSWYLFKWIGKFKRERGRTVSLHHDDDDDVQVTQVQCPREARDRDNRYTTETTEHVLAALPVDHQQALRAWFIAEESVEDLACDMGVSNSEAALLRSEALMYARYICRSR